MYAQPQMGYHQMLQSDRSKMRMEKWSLDVVTRRLSVTGDGPSSCGRILGAESRF